MMFDIITMVYTEKVGVTVPYTRRGLTKATIDNI